MTSTISIPLSLDKKGFLDRACPKCSYRFKVKDSCWPESGTGALLWTRTISYAFCPMCGHRAASDNWHTPEQIDAAKRIALEKAKQQILSEIDKSFTQLSRSFRCNPYVTIEYKSSFSHGYINTRTPFDKALERDIVCSKCNASYAVIGSAFFCPVCGDNTVVASFASAMSNISKALDALPAVKKAFEESGGIDFAKDHIRHLTERSVGDIVSAFQSFALRLYEDLGGRGAKPNDFQILDKGSKLFECLTGKTYAEWVSLDQLRFMSRMFQRRHILEHNNGLVDQTYLDKTNDHGYKIGERIIVRVNEVRELLSIALALGNGLLSLTTKGIGGGEPLKR